MMTLAFIKMPSIAKSRTHCSRSSAAILRCLSGHDRCRPPTTLSQGFPVGLSASLRTGHSFMRSLHRVVLGPMKVELGHTVGDSAIAKRCAPPAALTAVCTPPAFSCVGRAPTRAVNSAIRCSSLHAASRVAQP